MGRLSAVLSMQERLRALGAAATIGTDRTGGDERAADTLLTEAARSGLQARAGWRPRVHTARLPECPRDDRPTAPASALTTLGRLLADPDAELIDEWARLAAARGVLVDAATAPALLDWWSRQTRRSVSVLAALGRRGEWLASLNSEWQKPAVLTEIPGNADEIWQTGKGTERLAILISVRRVDPNRARGLVESTWKTDGANDRQRFLEVLIENRSMADEPFLERALDDRSKLVRRQAAAVLSRIPGSRLRQRASDAARAIVTIQGARDGILRRSRARVTLVPPAAFDASWERDGLEERPPEGIGPKAWWMRQILSFADLSIWTERTGLNPAAILDALKGDDYAGDALQALIAAAGSSGDADWSRALIQHQLDQPTIDLNELTTLLTGLPDETREALTLDIVHRAPLTDIDRWTILAAFDRPWSPAFSNAVMHAISAQKPAAANDWRLSRVLDIVSRRIAPEAIEAFENAVAHSFEGALVESARRCIDRVRLRAEMRKELNS